MVGERHEALAEAHHLFKLHRDGTEFVHRSGNVIFEVAVATEVVKPDRFIQEETSREAGRESRTTVQSHKHAAWEVARGLSGQAPMTEVKDPWPLEEA
jgi:hypothetical protein